MAVDNKKEKRKPGGGRKPSKPDYTPSAVLQNQMDAAVVLYSTADHPSLQTMDDNSGSVELCGRGHKAVDTGAAFLMV